MEQERICGLPQGTKCGLLSFEVTQWQAGEFGDEANSSLFWKELGEVERQRTLVISGSLEDLQAETLECVQNAEPPVHKLYIESPSSIAILSRENERMKERVYDI